MPPLRSRLFLPARCCLKRGDGAAAEGTRSPRWLEITLMAGSLDRRKSKGVSRNGPCWERRRGERGGSFSNQTSISPLRFPAFPSCSRNRCLWAGTSIPQRAQHPLQSPAPHRAHFNPKGSHGTSRTRGSSHGILPGAWVMLGGGAPSGSGAMEEQEQTPPFPRSAGTSVETSQLTTSRMPSFFPRDEI